MKKQKHVIDEAKKVATILFQIGFNFEVAIATRTPSGIMVVSNFVYDIYFGFLERTGGSHFHVLASIIRSRVV